MKSQGIDFTTTSSSIPPSLTAYESSSNPMVTTAKERIIQSGWYSSLVLCDSSKGCYNYTLESHKLNGHTTYAVYLYPQTPHLQLLLMLAQNNCQLSRTLLMVAAGVQGKPLVYRPLALYSSDNHLRYSPIYSSGIATITMLCTCLAPLDSCYRLWCVHKQSNILPLSSTSTVVVAPTTTA